MELDVAQALLRPGEAFPFQANVSISPQVVDSETVTFETVRLVGNYTAMDGQVYVSGTLATTSHAPCARCLKTVDYPLEISFQETFRKNAIETEDEDFFYEGTSVSLDHLSLTLAMLNLPMRFLCDENCQGSNELQKYRPNPKSSCQEDTQRPFEALKQLLEEDEEV